MILFISMELDLKEILKRPLNQQLQVIIDEFKAKIQDFVNENGGDEIVSIRIDAPMNYGSVKPDRIYHRLNDVKFNPCVNMSYRPLTKVKNSDNSCIRIFSSPSIEDNIT